MTGIGLRCLVETENPVAQRVEHCAWRRQQRRGQIAGSGEGFPARDQEHGNDEALQGLRSPERARDRLCG